MVGCHRGCRSCWARWPWPSSCSSSRYSCGRWPPSRAGCSGRWDCQQIRLAQRQVVRRPVRNALTIGVVYVAMAIGIGLGSIITTTVGDVRSWYRQTLQGDFFLRTAFPNNTTGESVLVPDALEEEVRHIPGVTSVDTMRFFNTHVGDRTVVVVSREFPDPEPPIALYRADPHEVRRRLLQGEVVIGTKLAQQLHVKPGDEIEVDTTRQGKQKLRVAALAIDYMVGGEIMYIYRATAEKLFDIQGVNTILATARPDSLSAVHDALAQIARRDQLMLHSFADLSRMLDRMMGGVIGGLWAILALGFVVAAFGIANTLTMNVLEQTRELALLRVVAMTRRQVRRLVLSQAAIIGLIGLGLGIIAGISTAYAIGAEHDAVVGLSGRLPLASLAVGGMSRLRAGAHPGCGPGPGRKGGKIGSADCVAV